MCVITAYGVQCLVAGCRGSGAEQQAMCPGSGMLHDIVVASSWFFSSTLLSLFMWDKFYISTSLVNVACLQCYDD